MEGTPAEIEARILNEGKALRAWDLDMNAPKKRNGSTPRRYEGRQSVVTGTAAGKSSESSGTHLGLVLLATAREREQNRVSGGGHGCMARTGVVSGEAAQNNEVLPNLRL